MAAYEEINRNLGMCEVRARTAALGTLYRNFHRMVASSVMAHDRQRVDEVVEASGDAIELENLINNPPPCEIPVAREPHHMACDQDDGEEDDDNDNNSSNYDPNDSNES